jgi:mono/diheme cytochrome c family protein
MRGVIPWLKLWWMALVAPVLLGAILGSVAIWPSWPCATITLDILPSEKAIPVDPPTGAGLSHVFRDLPTGTEFNSGVPYWIFRVVPRLYPGEFEGAPRDAPYSKYGLMPTNPPRPSGLPKGMVMANTELQLPGVRLGLGLKRVSFNCAGCHEDEYYGPDGTLTYVDGMPSHVADTQGFKLLMARVIAKPDFTPERVIAAIDAELDGLGKPRLTAGEKLAYAGIVQLIRNPNATQTWMNKRPLNGPGRIDAFDAVKYETLEPKVEDDGQNATVDLPSVWNQGKAWRVWHHWDGNTQDQHARNFGSVVGVGGSPTSVRGENVDAVAAWLDHQLGPPAFPFVRPHSTATTVAHGRDVFAAKCGGCHGFYDRETRALTRAEPSQLGDIVDVGTDERRWKAFDAGTAAALNSWGNRLGIWFKDSFRPAGKGYLAMPLDGIWARAPYLHNGSVPTLRELLTPPAQRSPLFYRGNRHYDVANLGWVYQDEREDGSRALFPYDTGLDGNSNGGHPFFADSPEDLEDLLDYLASL